MRPNSIFKPLFNLSEMKIQQIPHIKSNSARNLKIKNHLVRRSYHKKISIRTNRSNLELKYINTMYPKSNLTTLCSRQKTETNYSPFKENRSSDNLLGQIKNRLTKNIKSKLNIIRSASLNDKKSIKVTKSRLKSPSSYDPRSISHQILSKEQVIKLSNINPSKKIKIVSNKSFILDTNQ